MASRLPLIISQQLLSSLNTHISLYHAEHIPHGRTFVVVSNHRSFMDPMVLMVALNQSIRFACHQYMARVPLFKDVVRHMGAFALEAHEGNPRKRYDTLFESASQLLSDGDTVGLFPEGGTPMVQYTSPDTVGIFHRGFAHLLLRSPLPDVTLLPVAIASQHESNYPGFPIRLLHWFDPTEPLFDQSGLHPMVIYHHVNVMVGRPITITATDKQGYQGRHGAAMSRQLTRHCHGEISRLLKQGLSCSA